MIKVGWRKIKKRKSGKGTERKIIIAAVVKKYKSDRNCSQHSK